MKERFKVMIVDDDSAALSVAVALLEDRGYDVRQRDAALGTVVAVRREKPDVVLLDVQMPGLNGDTLTGLLLDPKAEHQPIVILHSTTGAAELERLAKSCNAAGFIEKTSDHRTFVQAFERIVARTLDERGRHGRTSTTRMK
jgi:CheY-like chemotaxis protein